MSGVKLKAVLAGAISALAVLAANGATPALALEPGYRELDAQNTLVIDTTKGQVIVEMYTELAPTHAARMTTLARQGFYDGVIFHRVIEDFMAQTGDPQGTGQGGSTLPDLKAEFTIRKDASFPMKVAQQRNGAQIGYIGAMPVQSQVPELAAITNDGKTQAWGLYCQGVLGMARDNSPDSGNSQFFLMRGANSVLEKRYTAFGTVVYGLDVVRKLKIGEPPVNPDKMVKVRVLADIPAGERPQIEIMDTNSSQFQAILDQKLKEAGTTFSPCDVTVPVKRNDTPPAASSAKPAAAPAPVAATAPPVAVPAATPVAVKMEDAAKPASLTAMPISPSPLQSQTSAGQSGY